ncbi:MAG: NADPH-dependent FMN reductase [Actinomycetales bacterium]|nr:NADPH-dependent FMN reductase [Actinomycetales bacterium]
MTRRSLVVVSAGLRVPSTTRLLADQLASAAGAALAVNGEVSDAYEVDVVPIEVRDHAHAIVDALLAGFPTGELSEALDQVAAADALVLVTPTFQASYSGLFKSFMDLIEAGRLRGKPVLLAATGGSDRHSLVVEYALRPLVAHLGAIAVPTGVYAATGDLGGGASEALMARIERAAGELAGLVGGGQVVAPQRDEWTDPTPFEQLLGRSSSLS